MPKVSVVVPNYNYARFLNRRLSSIANQTYRDFEVILLDDASIDESLNIMEQFATKYGWRLAPNVVNSGSVFKQWNKGLRLVAGEYIWIAESDDFADERLLETLIDLLEKNPRCGVAYCQSLQVDDCDNILGPALPTAFGKDVERWRHDFVANGQHEVAHYFLRETTIPNASAVMFRRSVCEAAGGADESFKLCGDYQFWASLLIRSDIAYVATPLNYYRTHARTIRSKTRAWDHLGEMFHVMKYILSSMSVPKDALEDLHGRVAVLLLFALISERPDYPTLKRSLKLAGELGFRPSLRAARGVVRHVLAGIQNRLHPSL